MTPCDKEQKRPRIEKVRREFVQKSSGEAEPKHHVNGQHLWNK